MNSWPTLKVLGEFAAILCLELLLLFAVAKLIALRLRSVQWQRGVWQITLVSMFLAFAGELNGVRGLFGQQEIKTPPATPDLAVVVTIREPGAAFVAPPIQDMRQRTKTPPISAERSGRWEQPARWLTISPLTIAAVLLLRMFVAQLLTIGFRTASRRWNDAELSGLVRRIASLLRIERKVGLARSFKATAPFTFGVWRPFIVLPHRFNDMFAAEQRQVALAHELAHIAGCDSAWRVFSQCLCAVLWWNPFVWLAARELNRASELVADESSLLIHGGPEHLAECLVQCAKGPRSPVLAAWLGMEGGRFRSALGQRVARLLHLRPQATLSRPVPWFLRILVPLLYVVALWIGMAVIKPASQRGVASWHHSLLGTVFAAAATPEQTPADSIESRRIEVARLVQDGKLFYETGRLLEAEAALRTALTLDPASKSAAYYLDLIAARKTADAVPVLHTRFFKVDPNTFLEGLQSLVGFDFKTGQTNRPFNGHGGGRGATTNSNGGISFMSEVMPATNVIPSLQVVFKSIGVDLAAPGKAVFYNDRLGVVMVKATLQDLDAIEKLVQMLNMSPPQVTIRVMAMEVPVSAAAKGASQFGLTARFSTNAPPQVAFTNSGKPTLQGVLTPGEFQSFVQTLEKAGGTDLMKAPDVITRSGGQAQIKVVDIRYIVTGLDYGTNGVTKNSTADANGVSGSAGSPDKPKPIAERFELGPIVDVIPYVETDGYTIQMTVSPKLREFLGYDEDAPADRIWATGGPYAPPDRQPTPMPKFRLRYTTATARVWDGQTLVLGAGTARQWTNEKNPGATAPGDVDKALFFFITPRLVDPAGNTLHSDEQLKELHKSVPKQAGR